MFEEGIWGRKSVKVAELRKLEQGGRTMEEFVQEFKRAARGSGYEGSVMECFGHEEFLFSFSFIF